jgi:hypothetical protein
MPVILRARVRRICRNKLDLVGVQDVRRDMRGIELAEVLFMETGMRFIV